MPTASTQRRGIAAREGPELIPGIPAEVAGERAPGDDFLMCVDGQPVAWTDGHGTWIDWRR